MPKIQYADGSTKKRLPISLNSTRWVAWPVDSVQLDVKKIEGRDYEYLASHIKQTERMNGTRMPSVWIPGTFGLQCDVLFQDESKIVLKNASNVFEIINTKAVH